MNGGASSRPAWADQGGRPSTAHIAEKEREAVRGRGGGGGTGSSPPWTRGSNEGLLKGEEEEEEELAAPGKMLKKECIFFG